MNKRGDLASILFIIVALFVIGIVFFFVNHMNDKIFTEFESVLNETHSSNETSMQVLDSFQATNQNAFDYAFLGVFLGSLIALGLTAYAVRVSPVFFWIYGLMSLVFLIAGVVLSNVWQEATADPTFTTTLTRFPITNAILGTYYPMIVVAILLISMIIMFGKPGGQEEGYL